MLVKNNGAAPITINLRDGSSYPIASGATVTIPDAKLSMLDDSAAVIALFNAGTLSVTTDAGAAFVGFPTVVNAADSADGKVLEARAKVGPDGKRTLIDQTGASAASTNPITDVVVDGDSLGANGLVSDATQMLYRTRGWWVHALSLIRGRVRIVNIAAVGGQTAQQILERFETSVLPYAPCEVWAIIGQNNLGDADNGAAACAAIEAYAEKCRVAGVKLRLGTVTPRYGANQTAQVSANIVAINSRIRALARAGICKFFDSHAAMVDATDVTGAALVNSTYDQAGAGIHPNARFALRIAREFLRTFSSEFAPYNLRPVANTDSRQVRATSRQLLVNPKLSGAVAAAGTGASGTEPTSWSLSRRQGANITVVGAGNQSEVDIAAAIAGAASGTYGATEQGLINSLIAGYNSLRQAVLGNTGNVGRTWFKMTVAGTASGDEIIGIQQGNVAIASMLDPVTPGVDRVDASRIVVRPVGLSSNFKSLVFRIEALNVSTVLFTVEGTSDSGDTQAEMFEGEQVIVCPGFLIPAGTTRLRVTLQATFASGACAGDIFVTDADIPLV